jgi:alkanesulfonate monooxygenase SsuD/methylene tetrahydromethanopterin reductase-like flavin-dependent oxidoreductase (luciferase family)
MSIRTGYLLPRERIMAGRPQAAPLLELAERAERLGFDSVWAGDSLLARPRHAGTTGTGMDKDYLALKRASASRSSGEWSDDDYDVLADGKAVGRIFKAAASPEGKPWMWTVLLGAPRGPHRL